VIVVTMNLSSVTSVLVPIAFESPLEAAPDTALSIDFEPGEHVTVTKSAARALQVAASIVGEGTVHLVHATPGLGGMSRYGGMQGAWLSMTAAAELDKAAHEYATRVLGGVAQGLCPKANVEAHAGPGKPSDVILNVAKRVKPDLIVLAASDHGRMRRALSSTADRVIHEAHTMVLVVPPHPE
jgi:nucleotide-binding universal stress UspA family protein